MRKISKETQTNLPSQILFNPNIFLNVVILHLGHHVQSIAKLLIL